MSRSDVPFMGGYGVEIKTVDPLYSINPQEAQFCLFQRQPAYCRRPADICVREQRLDGSGVWTWGKGGGRRCLSVR